MTNQLDNRTSKWWYRLLQVLFGVFISISVILIFVLSIQLKPEFDPYTSTYSIKCLDSGNLYGSYGWGDVNVLGTDLINDNAKELARFRCSRQDIKTLDAFSQAFSDAKCFDSLATLGFNPASCPTDYTKVTEIPTKTNYVVTAADKHYTGSWLSVIESCGIFLVILAISALFIRAVLLYVAFKIPFLQSLSLGFKGR